MTNCNSCNKQSPTAFCEQCHYPGIEDDYQTYLDLLDEGHSRHQAAVLSGWRGAEEIEEAV